MALYQCEHLEGALAVAHVEHAERHEVMQWFGLHPVRSLGWFVCDADLVARFEQGLAKVEADKKELFLQHARRVKGEEEVEAEKTLAGLAPGWKAEVFKQSPLIPSMLTARP